MYKFTKILSQTLAENNFIAKKDTEICRYGLEMFIICVLEICAVLVLSLIARNFFETVVYLTAFMPIRIYSSGYHANTRLGCFIILLAVYVGFSIIMHYIAFLPENIYVLGSVVISCLMILTAVIWTPLSNKNKSVTEHEKKYYRKMSISISCLECAIILIFDIAHIFNSYTQSFLLGLLTALISLVVGRIKISAGRRNMV